MIYFEKRKCEIFSFRHHQRRQNGFLRALTNAATPAVNGHKGFIEFRWWCFRLANVARFYFRSSIRFHFGAFLQSFQGKVKERSRNYILICCERSLTRRGMSGSKTWFSNSFFHETLVANWKAESIKAFAVLIMTNIDRNLFFHLCLRLALIANGENVEIKKQRGFKFISMINMENLTRGQRREIAT